MHPTANPVLLPAYELAEYLRQGKMSAAALVDASAARCAQVQPVLQGLARERFDAARREALAVDALRARGLPCGELGGLPMVVAESFAVEGMLHSGGIWKRADQVATRDAAVVAAARSAGGVVCGVANIAERGLGVQTDNLLYGRTPSPRDLRRVAGGSGGGVASLVATGCFSWGLAPDTLGEARIAAHCCGVMAYKPSPGRLPMEGYVPTPTLRGAQYCSPALITRHAKDAALLLRAMSGGPPGPALEDVHLTWMRVLVCEDPGIPGAAVPRGTRRVLRRALSALRAEAAEHEVWRPEQLRWAGEIWLAMMHEAHGLQHSFRDHLGVDASESVWKEATRWLFGRSRWRLPTLSMLAVDRLTRSSYVRIQRLCALGRRFRERLCSTLGDDGVLLLPTYPGPPPTHRRAWLEPRAGLLAALWNVLRLPVVQVSLPTSRGGLPQGVQLVGAPGRDDLLLAAALTLQRRLGSPPVVGVDTVRRGLRDLSIW